MRSQKQMKETVSGVMQRAKMKFESRATDDLVQAINSFHDLKPSFTTHQFPDGVTRWCVSLSGTIPIIYKNSTYHFPIALFLMDNHPYSGPYCYVCPTSTMRIRVSETVDEKGRVYLPYLTEWRYPGHDTCGLLQIMTIAFQEKSPMYSVSSSTSCKAQQPQSSVSTPYPTASHAAQLHYPYPVMQTSYPTSISHPVPQAQIKNSAPYPAAGAYSVSSYPPLSAAASGYQPPYQPYGFQAFDNHGPSGGSVNITNAAVNKSAAAAASNYGTVRPTHIHASLISAIEDKIRNRLREKIGVPFAELQSIDINLQELRTGQQKLRDMLIKIEQDQAQLDIIMTTYEDKKVELEKALKLCSEKGSSKNEPVVDDAIDATTPLHRQIFRCYVQDCVVDDTIYFLGQALKKGIISLQVYLKYVRQLSRKQFVHRATMQKCRLKAKLPA